MRCSALLLALVLAFVSARSRPPSSPDAFVLAREAGALRAAPAPAAATRSPGVSRCGAAAASDLGRTAIASAFTCAAFLALRLRGRRTLASTPVPGRRIFCLKATADDEDVEFDDEDDFDGLYAEDDMDGEYNDDEDEGLDEKGRPLQARCVAKDLQGSPMKFRRVLWQIRGRTYRDALMLLEFLPWRHCKPVLKAVQAAAASAQNHFNMDKSRLYISFCKAKKGMALKRMRPVSKGQAHAYLKHRTNLFIYVAEMTDKQIAMQMRREEKEAKTYRFST